MSIYKNFSNTLIAILVASVILSALIATTAVHADSPDPVPDNGTCIYCHDNLYFLHDTGKYFCLKESPMTCVDCHGGNPKTIVIEEAHIFRAAHPVVNEDISKCKECHPEQCLDRMRIFSQKAGISEVVLVAGPPLTQFHAEQSVFGPAAEETSGNFSMILVIEVISIVLVIGIALALHFHHRAHTTENRQ